jgi:D-aspartate ligase
MSMHSSTARDASGPSAGDAALVFNCSLNGLSIIRELARRGVREIHALDNARSIGTYSRYAVFHRCPDPLTDESAFIEYLLRFAHGRKDRPVLFPTNDEWAQALAHHKETLSRHYHVWVADGPVVDLIIQKPRFYAWAMSRGYPVPRSWTDAQAPEILDNQFPIAAKPAFRVAASDSKEQAARAVEKQRERLTILANRAQLEAYRGKHADLRNDYILQEYVRGLSDCMYTVGVYADRNHEVMGVFTGRKVRGFPPDVGDCMVGQVQKVDAGLVDMVKRMCRDLGYTGIAEFEFKRDEVSGRDFLIEINPRSWSWIGITPACGVSLPWMAYCDMTGCAPIAYAETDRPDGSVKFARVRDDRKNCCGLNRRVGFPQWHMTRAQWRKSLECDHLVDAEFACDDLRPWIMACWRSSLPVRVFSGARARIRNAGAKFRA